MSCVPFYAFLGEVARQAVHSFKSQTPMLDAMSVTTAYEVISELIIN